MRDDSHASESMLIDHTTTQESVETEKPARSRRSTIGGHYFEITLAALALVIPMLVLTVVLLSLVYTHLMPDYHSTYMKEGRRGIPLGDAYYVNYSATRLVFISSVSSTLAPFLISAATILFSYPLAYSIARNSDKALTSRLPSPYQLELIIEAVDARLKSLWNMLLYICSSRNTRTVIIPDLWKSITMLFGLGILALLTSLADVWLHVATSTVQHEQTRPGIIVPEFAPGRGLSADCLNDSEGSPDNGSGWNAIGCVIQRQSESGGGGLKNQADFIRTAGNESSINRIYISDGQAVIGPAPNTMPPNVDFSASSFASHTQCRMSTSECGAQMVPHPPGSEIWSIDYDCNSTIAGFNAKGNFSKIEAYQVERSDPDTSIGGTGLSPYQIGFRFFVDATMTDTSNTDPWIPASVTTPRLYWAFIFSLDSGWSISNSIGISPGRYHPKNMIGMEKGMGGIGGIMSCATNLSAVDYSFKNDSLTIDSLSLANATATVPFISPLRESFGIAQMRSGLELAVAGTEDARDQPLRDPDFKDLDLKDIKPGAGDDIAARFATAFDRTLVALPAGVLVQRPALDVTRRISTLVTRIPKAPLFAVVITNLLYAVLGLGLTAMALVSLGLGDGVRDAQARLGSAAIVAHAFEDERLVDDAQSVDQLFEERRGMGTGRVAICKRKGGGRGFIVVDREEEVRDHASTLQL